MKPRTEAILGVAAVAVILGAVVVMDTLGYTAELAAAFPEEEYPSPTLPWLPIVGVVLGVGVVVGIFGLVALAQKDRKGEP